jgi:hypothetical protein
MRRIVITIEGGLITSVMSDADGIEVLLVDYDTDDAPENELFTCPDGDKARMYAETPELLPDRVEEFFKCHSENEPA